MLFLLDGTSDSRELALKLKENGFDVFVHASTEHGLNAIKEMGLSPISMNINYENIISLCKSANINAIIDGSHPYAEYTHISSMKAAHDIKIKYIRFERTEAITENDKISYINSYEDALNKVSGYNILITTGIKNIEEYKNLINERNVIVRTIPLAGNIEKLIKLGVKRENIIAMEGSFSSQLEGSIMDYYKIDTLITKDSGFNTIPKIDAAKSRNIKIIVLKRPEVISMYKSTTIDGIIKILKQFNIK